MSKNILIVEDEALIAHRMEAQLRKNGYEVTDIVDNFDDAMNALRTNPADLILMDIVIKGTRDGIDSAINIQNTFNLPVIFLTAYSDEQTLQRAELANAYGYLVKPVNERELQAMLRIVLKRHAMDQELLKTISEVQKHSDLLKSSMSRLSSQVEDYNKVKLEDDLRYALERDQFDVHYQPQINIRTQKIIGTEALLRWNHPIIGSVSPASFIPKLEHTGMISEVGDWVLGKACQQLQQWNSLFDPDLKMSVNISSKQVLPGVLEKRLNKILSQYNLNPKNIDLEVTETVLLNHSEEEIEVFENLRTIGVRISIDDFGTGYSGLSYLQSFPFDSIKIDRAFISNISSGSSYSAIVIAIINLAKDLGLNTVAEGIETKQELEFLLQQGCDTAQGYYYSHPVSADKISKLLGTGLASNAQHNQADIL